MIPPDATGIFPRTAMDDYFALPHLNASTLKHARRSMAHVKAALDGRLEGKESPSMGMGSLIHTMILEPDMVPKRYIEDPGAHKFPTKTGGVSENYKATAAYKEWAAARNGEGLIVVSAYEMNVAAKAAAAARAHSIAAPMLGDGQSEITMVWDDLETGIRCKGRIDHLAASGVIVDVKTGADVSEFERSIDRWAWHLQAAFYRRGYETLTGERRDVALVAIEVSEPFGVRAARIDPATLDAADARLSQYLTAFRQCQLAGEWPCYASPDFWTVREREAPLVEADDEPAALEAW